MAMAGFFDCFREKLLGKGNDAIDNNDKNNITWVNKGM